MIPRSGSGRVRVPDSAFFGMLGRDLTFCSMSTSGHGILVRGLYQGTASAVPNVLIYNCHSERSGMICISQITLVVMDRAFGCAASPGGADDNSPAL